MLLRGEEVGAGGPSDDACELLRQHAGWSDQRLDLLRSGFQLYWKRASFLAQRAAEFPLPRQRNIAVVREAASVRPFGQILNQSTWTMYESDFDPETSSAELVAYLLLYGERLAQTGEVTLAAVHLAPYWFERSSRECADFARAAAAASRPDAGVFRAIARALPWLQRLRHTRLRPPRVAAGHRAVPATGLLVPRALEREPEVLVEEIRTEATRTLESFYGRWAARSPDPSRDLIARLEADPPPVLVAARGEILWDPEKPAQTGALDRALRDAGDAAVQQIAADLEIVSHHTTRFLTALADASALAPPDPAAGQSGYVYTHRVRGLLAYDLHEPHVDRLLGPPLPYASAMLGARAVHEWTHRAVDSGWVPRSVDDGAWTDLRSHLAVTLEATIAAAPRSVRDVGARGLSALTGSGSAGQRLTDVLCSRLPDYQANLLAIRFWSPVERETYVRQNIRSLRSEYAPERIWSMLVRYLYEAQYLTFSDMAHPDPFFRSTTWAERDLLQPRVLDEGRWAELLGAAAALCRAHAIDEARFR